MHTTSLDWVWMALQKRVPRTHAHPSEALSEWLDRDVSESVMTALKVYRDSHDGQRVAAAVSSVNPTLSELGEAMQVAAKNRVHVVEEPSLDSGAPSFKWLSAVQLLEEADTVYVGKEMDADMLEAAWEEDAHVIKKESPYFFTALGWRPLAEVNR